MHVAKGFQKMKMKLNHSMIKWGTREIDRHFGTILDENPWIQLGSVYKSYKIWISTISKVSRDLNLDVFQWNYTWKLYDILPIKSVKCLRQKLNYWPIKADFKRERKYYFLSKCGAQSYITNNNSSNIIFVSKTLKANNSQ